MNSNTSVFGSLISIKSSLFLAMILLLFCVELRAQPFDVGYNGKVDGVKVWQLPDAPDGTHPSQCWHAIGSAPNGEIYISGHDHVNNSMLYKLNAESDTLLWLGDAATASKVANNWHENEVAEKFHTRPLEHDGNVYVATLNFSDLNDGFLSTRGFHWYSYNIEQDTFVDLSAKEVGGIGAEHLQIVTIQIDKKNNVLYGASIPESKIIKYDIAKGQTEVLGIPWQSVLSEYVYTNRVMWIDSRGRLYITGGNGSDEAVDHVWYYEPGVGFGELPDFKLKGGAIETGQWNLSHTKFYMTDDEGHLYCFEDEGANWSYLGKPTDKFAWVLNLSPDGEKIYLGRSEWLTQTVYEYDIETGYSTKLCVLSDIYYPIEVRRFMTGYDSWDNKGSFYISNFSMQDGANVHILSIDPVRMKVENGLLPSLVVVNLEAQADDFIVSCTGNSEDDLDVIYKAIGKNNNKVIYTSYLKKTITSLNKKSEIITIEDLQIPDSVTIHEISITVLPDGNDYVVDSISTEITLSVNKLTKTINPLNILDATIADKAETFVYPNPFDEFINIRIDESVLDIAIYSVSGRMVYSKAKLNANQDLYLDNLSSGIYFLQITTNNNQEVFKISKN